MRIDVPYLSYDISQTFPNIPLLCRVVEIESIAEGNPTHLVVV